jgi:hypothetical protein
VLDIEEFATLSLITASSAILQTFIAFNSVSYTMVAYHERGEKGFAFEFKKLSEEELRPYGKEIRVLYGIKYFLQPHESDVRL